MTIPRDPAEALPGCHVYQQASIHYPLDGVDDIQRKNDRRPVRPVKVVFRASRTGTEPWRLGTPVVLGHEILKGGALSTVDKSLALFSDQPQWLVDIIAHIEAQLNGQES